MRVKHSGIISAVEPFVKNPAAFIDAGCEIPMPSCGMCGGFATPLASGDVCIATGTCNYPGRMGHHDSEIYLGNPATVAASAIEGRITDPRNYL